MPLFTCNCVHGLVHEGKACFFLQLVLVPLARYINAMHASFITTSSPHDSVHEGNVCLFYNSVHEEKHVSISDRIANIKKRFAIHFRQYF